MGHGQGGQGAEFNGEIPVAHRVQRVFADAVEPEQLAGALAVDRVGSAGQGGGAQGGAASGGSAGGGSNYDDLDDDIPF